MFEVKVIDNQTGDVVKTINAIKTRRHAEKVERGILINMNQDDYHTEIDGQEVEQAINW